MSESRTWLVPGQGVARVGMAGNLPTTSGRVFDVASEVLGTDVAELCSSGHAGDADLEDPFWAQVATVTVSMASGMTRLGAGEKMVAVVGHSLGEYSALALAGSIDVATCVRLVSVRANATMQASISTPGTMASLMGVSQSLAEELVAKTGAVIAAYNSPAQVSISGPVAFVDETIRLAKNARAKAVRLNIGAAYHSPWMDDAVPTLSEALAVTPFREPSSEVWSPTTARRLHTPSDIRSALTRQLTSPVLWQQTIEGLASIGVAEFVDVGPGKVVGNLVKRIVPHASIDNWAEDS